MIITYRTSAVTSAHWHTHTTFVHSLPPSNPAFLSRVHQSTGLHHAPSLHASRYPPASTSLAFHPNEMLYAVGDADGTIRLLGCKLQEGREQVVAEITRPYELPQPKEAMSVSSVTSSRLFRMNSWIYTSRLIQIFFRGYQLYHTIKFCFFSVVGTSFNWMIVAQLSKSLNVLGK